MKLIGSTSRSDFRDCLDGSALYYSDKLCLQLKPPYPQRATTLSAYGYVKVEKMTDRVYFTVEFEGEERLLFLLSRYSACGDILMAKYEVEGVNTSVFQV
jgi:hypothetical protein